MRGPVPVVWTGFVPLPGPVTDRRRGRALACGVVSGELSTELSTAVESGDWYHTIELPGGQVTPGFFDHRSVLSRYPLPADMTGSRVLDVGSADGFFSFEMERRGASVLALDVPDRSKLDFPAPLLRRPEGERFKSPVDKFELVRDALGSKVERRLLSAYEISPETVGTFDVVFVGSVLIHTRDPVAILMRLASVCSREILMVEVIDRRLDRSSKPLARFQGMTPHLTWWIPNRAAWTDMLGSAGFEDVRHLAKFVVPYGRGRRGGVLHSAMRARPASAP
jgi:tRNA (mo5U34)-methyltransferase